jgi:hypothetical protein
MTSPADIEHRLRECTHNAHVLSVCTEAADTIAQLVKERDEARANVLKMCAAELDAVQRASTAEAEAATLREALEPFSDMAGELFARNWNASDVVIALDNPDDPHRLTAGDFFALRRARTQQHGAKE